MRMRNIKEKKTEKIYYYSYRKKINLNKIKK
jgi:hypothetical protein